MDNPLHEAIRAERLRDPMRPRLFDVFETERGRMAAALAYRMGGPAPEDDGALPYVGMGFREMCETIVSARGESWNGPSELLARALTTSDVPALLATAGNAVMLKSYQSYAGGLLRFCGRIRSRDFRDVKAVVFDGDVALKELSEGGEIQEGNLKSNAESFPISTFARMFTLTRTVFMDDDLGAFADLGDQLGKLAAEFSAAKVVATLESSTAMLSDGHPPFHSSHKNLGTSGALSEATLGELLKLMRDQVGLGGERISVVPRAVVVPSALELPARKLLWLLGPQAPYEVVVEPRLTSATNFFVISDPAFVAAIGYSSPAGSEAPRFALSPKPTCLALRGKVTLDFGCGWMDFRGAAKNAGV